MTDRANIPTASPLGGLAWRVAQPEDVSALKELQILSNARYGPLDALAAAAYENLFPGGEPATTLCAVTPSGDIVAFGSVAVRTLAHEHRAYLDGLVHPDFRRRGLGTFLLEWAQATGAMLLGALPSDRPAVLTIDFMDRRDDATGLYERHGFAFKLAEETMRRDLHEAIAAMPAVQGVALAAWAGIDPRLGYEVYDEAFRQRPGFPGWSEKVWRENFTASEAFRPDLSLVASVDGTPVGYSLCEVVSESLPRRHGWITQLGVRPAWRERGVGAMLLGAALRGLRAEGLDDALLDVNINNPGAQRLYRRLGFGTVARRVVYAKPMRPIEHR